MSTRLLAVTLGAPHWMWPTAGLCGVLLALVLYGYASGDMAWKLRATLATLKSAGIITLGLILLEPMGHGQRPRPHANIVALLVDDSRSMKMLRTEETTSFVQQMRPHLDPESEWRTRLGQWFDVRSYAFGARLRQELDLEELSFTESSSNLMHAFGTLETRFRRQPMAAVVLFTDGNATDRSAEIEPWTKLNCPVYPVIPSRCEPVRDIGITRVNVTQTDFETAPVEIQVNARTEGLPGKRMVVQLQSEQNAVLEEQLSTIESDEAEVSLRFRHRPTEGGLQFLRVVTFLEQDREQWSEASIGAETGSETTWANNHRWVAVDRGGGPYRILYVAGRPNWEFKFLRRAAQADDELQLVGLIRIARREPKFSFRDRDTGNTNPLFAGLDDAEDENPESYDEPVLIRLGVATEQEIRGGFPKTVDELFEYQAIILDDLEADFLTPDQLLMLRRFVSARGGGLLLLGGAESFGAGGFATSALGELAPVYAVREPPTTSPRELRYRLTREGLLQPWLRLRDTEPQEMTRLDAMPSIATWNRVGRLKPGASLLAVGESEDDRQVPLFAWQRFGAGRSAALVAGDMWRMAMHRPIDGTDDLPQAWRQMLRWLVTDTPRRVEIAAREDRSTGQCHVTVTVRDEEYRPLDNAEVSIEMTKPDGSSQKLLPQPSDAKAGEHMVTTWPLREGGYRVTARVRGHDGSLLGDATTGWTSHPGQSEYDRLTPDEDAMRALAAQTGGKLLQLSDLPQLADQLPTRDVPVQETWVYPLWHNPWVVLFALSLFCTEWGLRRWHGWV